MPPLSVLDLSPVVAGSTEAQALHDTVALAIEAERLGFHRYWLAEHHGGAMVASSSPEIMIGAVAGATSRIRVGSGGVMLPNHTPLHVAEQFKVLEALHPGRIDLGIGRAPGTDQLTAYALRRDAEKMDADDFPQQLGELLGFAGARPWPANHPFRQVRAAPTDVPLPPVYLLGSSAFSAQVAAANGFGFAFAAHIAPDLAVDVLRLYRERFRPSRGVPRAQRDPRPRGGLRRGRRDRAASSPPRRAWPSAACGREGRRRSRPWRRRWPRSGPVLRARRPPRRGASA